MLHIRGEAFLPGIVHHAAFAESSMSPVDSTLELVKDSFFSPPPSSLSALIRKFDDVFFCIVSPPASLETQRPQS